MNGSRVSLPRCGRVLLVQLRAQGFQLGHVDFLDVGEVRDAALGLLHLLRDLAAQPDHGDGFFLVPLGIGAAAGSRRRLAARCQVDVEVLVHDAAGRAAAVHVLQFDAQVPGTAAHGRRGDGLVAGRAGRWRLCAGRSAGLVLHRGDRRGDRRGRRWRVAGSRARAQPPPAFLGAAGAAHRLSRCPRLPLPGGSVRRPRPSARPTVPPSDTTLPATGDGISTVALSVITSARTWSSLTVSPGFTCQATSSTWAMPSPMSGILIT